MSVNVTSWHNDPGLTGLNANEVSLAPSNVNTSTFGKLFTYPATGQVYAQPLYVANVVIPGKGTHNVIIVATENNDVYALDANNNAGAGAGVLWHVNLGLAAATPNSFFANRYGPYHDINPQVGITSTPVIDVASGTIYVDAFTNDVAGQNSYSHHIHALSLTTGADKVTPMLVSAAVKGNGVSSAGGSIAFVATDELQRPALTLLNGVLYVAYSGYADTDPYHGWILGFSPTDLHLVSAFNDTPNLLPGGSNNPGEGGIWQTGSGLASDGTNLFVMVGNGDFSAAQGDWGDSILKIAPDTSTVTTPNINGYGVKVTDSFTPYNQQSLADADVDLGSGGGIVLPDQPGLHPHEYVGAGKQGLIYLVNRDNMGQFNATTDNVLQEVSLGHGVFSSPAYFNSAIYYHAVGDVLKKYALTNGMLSAAPVAQSNNSSYSAVPSISANGTANGIVWDIQNDATHQVLHAYDAGTLAELYNSNQNATRDQMGTGVKFITPTIADGEVFVGGAGSLNVYGLVAPPTTAPAAPSGLAAAAPTASTVQLTWVRNSNNESGFKIERSPDGVTFTQIAVSSANTTSFLDTTVSAATKYYYRIRATNVIGDSAYTATVNVTTPAATGATYVYHFDAGTGTAAVDSNGGNNGTLTGTPLPVWSSPGKTGASSLAFSGDGTYNQAASQSAVKVTTDLAPVLGSTMTFDAWFRTTQVGSATHWQAPAITGVEQAGGASDINLGTLDATGRIGIYVGDSGGIFSLSPVNDGAWHNVAMTRDAVSGVVQLFVDGVSQGSGTFDTGNKTSKFLLIGALSDVANDGVTFTGANYFKGTIDEVRVYNQVIGSAEISGLSVAPGTPTLTGASAVSGSLVHLTWTTPSSFTQSIEIDRKAGGTASYVPIATVAGGVNLYDDQTVTAGTTYFYTVKATDTAGSSNASNVLSVTPPVPTVVDEFTFYNGSKFDDQNGTSNLTDRSAIASDKQPLLPGQTATFANYTSYSKGINGVLVDVANLDMIPRFEDFSFKVGNDSNPSGWAVAPIPELVNVYPGRGTGGSTQITVIWDDNDIQNEWLQFTVLGNSHTGLASDVTFYFGNAIAESGNAPGDATVDASDEILARNNQTGVGNPATITNPYDYNRDGFVDATDQIIARNNQTGLFNKLAMISAPSGAPVPAALSATVVPVPRQVARPTTALPSVAPAAVFGRVVITPPIPVPTAGNLFTAGAAASALRRVLGT